MMRAGLCREREVVVDAIFGLLAALSSGALRPWVLVIYYSWGCLFSLADVGLLVFLELASSSGH